MTYGSRGNLSLPLFLFNVALCYTLIHYAEAVGTPVHMLEVQDYSHPQSQESLQDYNQSPETAQYYTPYFISREELPQANCNSLKTVQVSRLGANKQSEHIQPAWNPQSKSLPKVH